MLPVRLVMQDPSELAVWSALAEPGGDHSSEFRVLAH
jgi:hypothetical protein